MMMMIMIDYCYCLLLVCDTPAVSGSSLCPEAAGYNSSSRASTPPPPNADYGAECSNDSGLPCTYGTCTFLKDSNGVLDRTGSCLTRSGQLFLQNKGITGLRNGVFNNMGACTHLYLHDNQLGQSNLPGSIFNGLSNLGYLFLDNNQLSNLPAATVFDGLTNLKSLVLSYNQLSNLPATIFDGLTNLQSLYLYSNQGLTCVPLMQARIAALSYYAGPGPC
jgi:Leucine-rich repeat (LRR) protein